MANKNFGRRMVDEESITKIGQGGGGGTPIEAGTGISITGTDTKTIAVDTETVALKTDIPTYTAGTGIDVNTDTISFDTTNYDIVQLIDSTDIDFTDVTYDSENTALDISNVINAMPLLVVDNTTNYNQLPNPIKLGIDRYLETEKNYFLKGVAVIEDLVNNQFLIVSTQDNSALNFGDTYSFTSSIIEKEGFRDGADSHLFMKSRAKRNLFAGISSSYPDATQFKINGVLVPTANVRYITIAASSGEVAFKPSATTGVKFGRLSIEFIYEEKSSFTNYNNGLKFQSKTPGVTYQLNATAASDGNLSAFEWAPLQVASPVYEYLVSVEFQETGTGAGTYTVYFNLRSTTNYDPQTMDFATLRNLIIANGDNIACRYIGTGNAVPQYVTTSTNAGDDTILVQYTDSNYFEFMAYSELMSAPAITKLNY